MTTEYYCAIFSILRQMKLKKKKTKKQRHFMTELPKVSQQKVIRWKYKTVSHVSLLIKKVRKNEGGVVLVGYYGKGEERL